MLTILNAGSYVKIRPPTVNLMDRGAFGDARSQAIPKTKI